MGKLKNIDKKAAGKGKGIETVWQFVKFIFVSLLAMIVQFALLNLLPHIPFIAELYAKNQPFEWWVFTADVYTAEIGGIGYFIVANTANIMKATTNSINAIIIIVTLLLSRSSFLSFASSNSLSTSSL